MKLYKIFTTTMLMAAFATSCNHNTDINSFDPPTPDNAQVSQPTEQLIYEANPAFFSTDQCFNAINDRLGEIQALGTNVLWIMPIYTPGEVKAIGSPYCVKDFTGINPKYGDMSSLRSLVDAAHAKGMIVILDWIANHTAWDNAWITEHPDWYAHDSDGKIISPPGQGWTDVAQLNYESTALRSAMIDAMTYWMTQANVDGFRCDYADGVPATFWSEAISKIRSIKANAFMLAETNELYLYDCGFDMIYDWSYCTDLQDLYKGKISFDKLADNVRKRDLSITDGKHIMRYVLNHDVIAEKSPQELYGSEKAVIGAYVLTAFIGQVPLIYSGMEAGFDDRTDFINAKPMKWDPSLQAEYSIIGKAYKATETARAGTLHNYDSGSKGLVFARANGEHSVLVLVNPTDANIQVKIPMAYIGVGMTDMISGNQMVMTSVETLPAYEYKVFSK